MGRALAALDVQVDMIISSPLKRSAQTASLVGNELSYEGKLQLEDALRPGASYADFRRLAGEIREAGIHHGGRPQSQPKRISGARHLRTGCEAGVELKKGAVAKVEMGRNAAILQWCLTPRVLREIYAAATESSRPKTSRK